MKLPQSFYQRDDVLQISRELLGKVLVTNIDGKRTSGMIVEVEAYAGELDKASHAFGGRNTQRTAPMFGPGGMTYVYLIYGIHSLLNVVTNNHGTPHAILIRGIDPLEGIETMLKRRNKKIFTPALTAGPGALAQALGITTSHTNKSLQGPEIRIEDKDIHIKESDIIAASRVGVAYAGEDAKLPYRFYIKGNPFVSKAKGL